MDKHFKRLRRKALIALALLIFIPACARPVRAAEEIAVSSADSGDEIAGFSVEFNKSDWEVIIYGLSGSELLYCAAHNVSYDSLHSFLRSANMYVDAIHRNEPKETTIRRLPADTEKCADIRALSGSRIRNFAKEQAEFFEESGGCVCDFKQLYKHSQTTFMVYDFTYSKNDGTEYEGIRYYTVLDGHDYYIDYYVYSGSLTEKDRRELENIVDSVIFSPLDAAPAGTELPLMIGLFAAAALIALLTVLFLIRRSRSARIDSENNE